MDHGFRDQWPTLWDFLTITGLGGKQRVTGSLLIFHDDGKVKGMLNDRDSDHVAFVSADVFQGLLEALEKGLRDGGLDWRPGKGKKK